MGINSVLSLREPLFLVALNIIAKVECNNSAIAVRQIIIGSDDVLVVLNGIVVGQVDGYWQAFKQAFSV